MYLDPGLRLTNLLHIYVSTDNKRFERFRFGYKDTKESLVPLELSNPARVGAMAFACYTAVCPPAG